MSNFKCQIVLKSSFVHLFSSVSLDKLYTLSEIQLLHLYDGYHYRVIGKFKELTCIHGILPRDWYTEDSQPCTNPYMIYTWPLAQSHICNEWQILMNTQAPLLHLPLFSYCIFSWEKQWNMDNRTVLTAYKSVTSRQAVCMLSVKRATYHLSTIPFI